MQTLITHLEAGRQAFLNELEGVTPSQWQAKPAPDRWSILEVAEHVATVEIGIYSLLKGKLFESPCSPEQQLQIAKKDGLPWRKPSTPSIAPAAKPFT